MKVKSEQEMLKCGRALARELSRPAVIELVGDVGAGKTTLVRGLAEGLGVRESVTSPSFTISKSYALPDGGVLSHYDFYRLSDPGIMVEDLAENMALDNGIVIIEWGQSVEDLLPEKRIRIMINYVEGGREVKYENLHFGD